MMETSLEISNICIELTLFPHLSPLLLLLLTTSSCNFHFPFCNFFANIHTVLLENGKSFFVVHRRSASTTERSFYANLQQIKRVNYHDTLSG